MILCDISEAEGSKDAKNLESIKAVSVPDDLVVQAPNHVDVNENSVSKNYTSDSVTTNIEQPPESTINSLKEENISDGFEQNSNPFKNLITNVQTEIELAPLSADQSLEAATDDTNIANATSSKENQTELESSPIILEKDTNSVTKKELNNVENKAKALLESAAVDVTQNKEPMLNQAVADVKDSENSELAVDGIQSTNSNSLEKSVAITVSNGTENSDASIEKIKEEKIEIINQSTEKSEISERFQPQDIISGTNAFEKTHQNQITETVKDENQNQVKTAAFTTQVNLNITSSTLNKENELKNNTTENVVILEPKKIYVEKSSTVIQVLDPSDPNYSNVEHKTSSVSESESGTDNNEYEFVDANDLVEANKQLGAAEKRAQRNSISTLSITLINHNETNEFVDAETLETKANTVENEHIPHNVVTEAIQEPMLDNSETVKEDENSKVQYKAVLAPVDKPLFTKLSRKQKKSMRELQKIARERAKSKLASQLSTSSSESGATDISENKRAATETAVQPADSHSTKVEIAETPDPPIKTTTVVQLAQNSSKTVPVPPKRPSKIPISRQRSVSKGETKTPESSPSKIPIKTITIPQTAKVVQKVAEVSKNGIGNATPEFTNSASIVLKPLARNQSLRSQTSDEIASEMESSVQIVKDLNRKFSMTQNRSLSKKSSVDSTTSSKQLSYTKSLDNDSDSSVSDSNVEEILERSSDEVSYEEFDEYDEEIVESDTEDYNKFDKEHLQSAARLNINLSEIREKVNQLTSNLNQKQLNSKKSNSYIEETCESSEDYLSEEELEEDDIEETSEDDMGHLTEKLKNDLNIEIKQPTELELMQVRTHFKANLMKQKETGCIC